MKTRYTASLGLALAGLLWCGPASAGLIFNDTPYRSAADSPFDLSSGFQFEDFEDGLFNMDGLVASSGIVKGPGRFRDSVDGDDGTLDGLGNAGWSLKIQNPRSVVDFTFDGATLGGLPTQFGMVFTDGEIGATYRFKAWDADGRRLGSMRLQLGDRDRHGKTREDRFLGVEALNGISRIRFRSNGGGIELDHLQFGNIVPSPGALALLGLAGLIARRRRRG